MLLFTFGKGVYTVADKLYKDKAIHCWIIVMISAGIIWMINGGLPIEIEGFLDVCSLLLVVFIVIMIVKKVVKDIIVEKIWKICSKCYCSAKSYDLCMMVRKPVGNRHKEQPTESSRRGGKAKVDIEYFLEQEKGKSLYEVVIFPYI